MWKLGGLPLVLVGLGAANIFIPEFGGYDNNENLLVTGFLFISGIVAWSATVYVAYERWKAELNIVAERERILIQSMCEIVKTVDSDAAAKDRVKTLTTAVQEVKLQKVENITILGAQQRENG